MSASTSSAQPGTASLTNSDTIKLARKEYQVLKLVHMHYERPGGGFVRSLLSFAWNDQLTLWSSPHVGRNPLALNFRSSSDFKISNTTPVTRRVFSPSVRRTCWGGFPSSNSRSPATIPNSSPGSMRSARTLRRPRRPRTSETATKDRRTPCHWMAETLSLKVLSAPISDISRNSPRWTHTLSSSQPPSAPSLPSFLTSSSFPS